MPWTRNQESAIALKGRTVLVSAAAGSGKTAVLVERIVSRILEPESSYSIEDLLVMTFTRAAASGMKERIKKALEKALSALPPERKAERRRIRRELTLVDLARICTIDSFCMSLVKENIDKVDMDPAFRIADEEDLKLLQSDVLGELMEEEYEAAQEDFLFLLDVFAKVKGDDGLLGNIDRIYRCAQSMAWPMEYLDALEKGAYSAQDLEELMFRQVKAVLEQALRDMEYIEGLAAGDEDLHRNLFGKRDEKKKKESLGIYNKENNEKDTLCLALRAKSLEEQRAALSSIKFHTLNMSKNKDTELAAKVKMLRSAYKADIQALFAYLDVTKEELLQEEDFSARLRAALLRLTREYTRRLQEKKTERGIADFNDIAHAALHVLWQAGEKTDIAKQYARDFKEIYVDEYQDSNFIQEELLRAIENNNVFMVGDVKQSIYGFRQAKPALFIEKYKKYPLYREGQPESKEPCKVILSDNFRSRASVLESVNALFYRLMGKDVGDILYDEDAALHAAASYTEDSLQNSAGKTRFCYLDKSGADEEAKRCKDIEWEAKLIAWNIRDLMRQRMHVQEEGRLRPLMYRDIVILLRNTKGKAKVIADELLRQGIPCYASSKHGFFDTYEIQKFLAFLSVIDNPTLELPLCAYLKSPVVCLDNRALALFSGREIRGERDVYRSLLYILEIFAGEEEEEKRRLEALLGRENIRKVQRAFAYLERYRRESAFLPLHVLIRKILTETSFLDYVSAMPGGEVRRANLLLLMEKAKSYEESGYSGLFDFIRYIADLKEQNTDFGEASLISENADTVRIMTIHASKGLEYPVCIVAGLASSFGSMDLREKMLIEDEFGLSFSYKDMQYRTEGESLQKRLAKERIKEGIRAEELRLLYVAMTRAKELLILTSCFRLPSKEKEYGFLHLAEKKAAPKHYIASAGSYLDWFWMCKSILQESVDFQQFSYEDLRAAGEEERKMEVLPEDGEKDIAALFDCRSIEKMLDFSYAFQEDTRIHNKVSVSELKRKQQEQEDMLFKYQAKERSVVGAKQKASERGNAYHRLMDLLDFAGIRPTSDLRNLMEMFLEQGYMEQEEQKLIDIREVEAFLRSALFARMAKAASTNALHREKQFYMSLAAKDLGLGNSEELVLVQGVVDAYIEEEDGISIIDYKTDKVSDKEELLKRYEKQLDYYALAISKSTQKPVKDKIIWSFSLGEEIRYEKGGTGER